MYCMLIFSPSYIGINCPLVFPINETPVIKTPRTMKDSTEASTSLKTAIGVMTPYKFGCDVLGAPCLGMKVALPAVNGIIS